MVFCDIYQAAELFLMVILDKDPSGSPGFMAWGLSKML